jgi:hypothetical protein
VTEVERYVRDRVAATGEPLLVVPAGLPPALLAMPLWMIVMDGDRGPYILVEPPPQRSEEAFTRATLRALQTCRRWVPEAPEGVEYVYQEGAIGVVQQVEATALGLSLLQLALNRAVSGLAVVVSAGW